jgi:hypothetical protein
MAVRSAIQYMAHYILRELGIATYVPASISAAATSMRVMDASLFDPSGGQCFVEDNDNLITYTGIDGDQLTGIPSANTGSISATINPYTSASRDLVVIANLISAYELERHIDRYRVWLNAAPVKPEVTKKKFIFARGWFDTDVELRNDDDDGYTVITADAISYENGEWEFNTARTETELYVAGWAYNPFATIADIIETFAADSRWARYIQIGQSAESKHDAHNLAGVWRSRAAVLNFLV